MSNHQEWSAAAPPFRGKHAHALPSTTKSCRATQDGWSEPMPSHEGRMKRVKPVIKWRPYITWQLVSIYCVCCCPFLLLPALSPTACCLLYSLPLPLFKFPTISRAFCFSNSIQTPNTIHSLSSSFLLSDFMACISSLSYRYWSSFFTVPFTLILITINFTLFLFPLSHCDLFFQFWFSSLWISIQQWLAISYSLIVYLGLNTPQLGIAV